MGGGLVLNTVQICAMARSILLILALPYTLRFSLFEQYWALCLSSSGCDDPTGQQETLAESPFTRTSTRPPPISASAPCPYRAPGTHASRWACYPLRLEK